MFGMIFDQRLALFLTYFALGIKFPLSVLNYIPAAKNRTPVPEIRLPGDEGRYDGGAPKIYLSHEVYSTGESLVDRYWLLPNSSSF